MGSLELQEEVSKASANSQEEERAVKLQMQQGGLWSFLILSYLWSYLI